MENENEYPKNDSKREDAQVNPEAEDEAEFENPSVDPGFANEEEEQEENQASSTDKSNDALNYKNDREHGAYNPKNI